MESIMPEKIKDVYDRLVDEESRLIFEQRLMYSLDGNIKHFLDIFSYLNKKTKYAETPIAKLTNRYNINKNPGKIVLFGVGTYCKFITYVFNEYGLKADCFCDSNPSKQNTLIDGIPVISPEKLLKDYCDEYIVISSIIYYYEIRSFLLKSGISEDRILSPAKAYGDQYFIPEFEAVENEIFVDAGCLNGGNIFDFLKFCGGKYKKIYGFEPDPVNYGKTIGATKGLENTFIFDKGIWSEEAILTFNNCADGRSKLSENGEIKVVVDSIDNVIAGEPVTFIKMDIEGAELEALRGAKNTIQANKPRLAICIYHKPEDVLSIPLYIMELVPEYRFYVRHHSLSSGETVLYAVI